ncbi:MAG: HD domain-containing phosphohydrolase [Bacteriovoracia bacterium]
MDIVSQNVHWLIPEEPAPCDLYLHFRGKFALGLAAKQLVSLSFLEKLAKTNSEIIFLKKQDLFAWEEWKKKRHPEPEAEKKGESTEQQEKLYGNKRAEFLSYVQKILHKRDETDRFVNNATDSAAAVLKKVIGHPMLDWYFQQFHEPPDLFFHAARVAYPFTAFCLLHALGTDKEIESATFAAVIHELSGDPKESLKTVVSQQTLAQLEREKQPVPADVIELIRMHDELFSGKGFPGNKKKNEIPTLIRAFGLFNHFDHYRLAATGTRRARFDQAKQKMNLRRSDYDPDLWENFWKFWENSVEAIT